MNAEIERKKEIVISYLESNPYAYISEISDATGIPKSSIQRYLEKEKSRIILSTGNTIQEQLKLNKLRGQRKGGIISFENNDSVKDEKGRFVGTTKTSFQGKTEQKLKDIMFIALYYLARPQISLQDMADELEVYGKYTKDYIYDCLTDQRLASLVGQDNADQINRRLEENRPKNIESEQPSKLK